MKKHIDTLLASMIGLISFQSALVLYERLQYGYIYKIITSTEIRPFVYRVFVPYLSRTLSGITGIDILHSLFIVMTLSGIGMYYSIRYLYKAFRNDDLAGVISFGICLIIFMVTLLENKVYDMPTALFFSLSLALLARGQFWEYYLIFPLATLNRETTFLLGMFYAIYFFHRLSRRHWFYGLIYQFLVYFILKLGIMYIFADLPGAPFLYSLPFVIYGYSSAFAKTLIYILCLLVVSAKILRRWNEKPEFLRIAFMTMFPIMFILYLIMGQAFEIRVFVEIVPIMCILSIYPLPLRKFLPVPLPGNDLPSPGQN